MAEKKPVTEPLVRIVVRPHCFLSHQRHVYTAGQSLLVPASLAARWCDPPHVRARDGKVMPQRALAKRVAGNDGQPLPAPAPVAFTDKRGLLAAALEAGLISDEEFGSKMRRLEAESAGAEPAEKGGEQ